MQKQGVSGFKYFVGINSLYRLRPARTGCACSTSLVASSSSVTPVGHSYSGGNVVFGTSPGRRGQVMHTAKGDIPVYNSVLEGLEAGHQFNCGVIYLPPAAARDGVAELIRVNQKLEKIFIITEKMSVHDAREIRAMGQTNGIDIFGGNSLGVADAWNEVRIGGALGGDNPGEALKGGSIAILSNSGNFTTTMATYLRMAGWGTTTLISSGKDVYIHYAAPEFAFALANDARSKAAVLYVEPGGYYELDAEFRKAGRGLCCRTLEEKTDSRRRPCRRDVGRLPTTRSAKSAGSWTSSASRTFTRRTSRSSRQKGPSSPTLLMFRRR